MALRITVCIAQVVDIEQPIEVGRGACGLDEEGLAHMLNPADACAMEAALQLRDRFPGSQVVAVSMGPARCDEALRDALAQGVDEAVRVWDDVLGGCDCRATARVLAAAAHKLGSDIVVCGDRSLDGGSGILGAQIAELLGLPLLEDVVRVEVMLDERALLCELRLGGGLRAVERAGLPAVLTIAAGVNVPRYPALRTRLAARSVVIPCWSLSGLRVGLGEVNEEGSALRTVALLRPPPDPRGLFKPSSDLSGQERYMVAIGGGVEERQGGLCEGSPDELAAQIVADLEQGGFLRPSR